MTRNKYKRQGDGSFFGEYLSDRTVPNSRLVRDLPPPGSRPSGVREWDVIISGE